MHSKGNVFYLNKQFFPMKNFLLPLSLFAIAIIWGTTYLGIRVAVESIPPIYVAGIRHTLSAIILLIYLTLTKKLKWIGWENLKIQMVLSLCVLIITNGFVTIAETTISSSLASLIGSFSPILVFIGSVILKMQKFTFRTLSGVLLAFSGIVFVFWDNVSDLANADYRTGIIFVLLSVLGSASGTIFIRKTNYQSKHNIFLNLFYQFVFAGVIQMGYGLISNEEMNLHAWSNESILALLYLTIFGSIIAYVAYTYALSKVPVIKVSLLSYVNTLIAIFLGWLVLDEPVDSRFIIATAMIILGIFITNYNPNLFKKKQ